MLIPPPGSMKIRPVPPGTNDVVSDLEQLHEETMDASLQLERGSCHRKLTRRYGASTSVNGHIPSGLNVRKSSRLRKIPAPYIRTSLSPEVYARAARTGMPLPDKKRPRAYNNPYNSGSGDSIEPRHEPNLRELEAHPVLSNESRENNRNDPTYTDDMDETPDPVSAGNVDLQAELPQIYANRWIPHQAAHAADPKNKYNGCWYCRIKHKKCAPAGDSCTGCKEASVKCLGRGQPRERWMRDDGARKIYLEQNGIRTNSMMQRQLLKGHPKSSNMGKSSIQHVRFLSPAEAGSSRHRSPELCASPPSWGKIDTNLPSSVLEQDSDDDNVHSSHSSEASLVFSPPPFESKPKKQVPAKWKQEHKEIRIKGKTVAQFLKAIDLDHKVQMFHQVHLRSERDLQGIAENIQDPKRREELWKLLESKGLSIIDWWAINTALNV